jgi:phosphoglycerate dehydrogenase-like enzyme
LSVKAASPRASNSFLQRSSTLSARPCSRPQGSPLWDLENAIISPHSTASVPGRANELLVELFSNNLWHYLNGEPLINELDKKLVY